MKNSFGVIFTLSASIILTARSSGGSSNGGGTPPLPTPSSISGPVDIIQDSVSSQIMLNMASAVAGTPLGTVILCADDLLIGDAIDVADAVLANVSPDNASDPQALFYATSSNLQQAVDNFRQG